MSQKGLSGFFEKFLDENSIFLDKKALQTSYVPTEILHREEQVKQIAQILGPVLREEVPSNLFVYGVTGTGKTLSVKYVRKQLLEVAEKHKISLKILYLNCKLKKIADTEYRLLAQLIREYRDTIYPNNPPADDLYNIPSTGLPTDEVYNRFLYILDKTPQTLIIVLDEIDQLVKKTGDEIIYNLTRINSELKNSQVAFVGISNSLRFIDNIDPRVRSSLRQEELIFPTYNALEIQDILRKRSEEAFKPNVVVPGLIEKCSAYAAREHGDARRALDLLRIAGEVAERQEATKIELKHLDEAEEKLEKEKVVEIVKKQPKQSQAVFYCILVLQKNEKEPFYTGDVYNNYKKLCTKTDLRPLTQRRVSDIISELDMLGIINTHIISKGRYGRTKEINVEIQEHLQKKVFSILSQELGL